jgi:hypothetical protein
VGTFNWTATATDTAGNKGTQSGTYKVVYKFSGFLQPINDTAHQTGLTTSVFKAGSTIPVKFQLKNAAGTAVQSATAPVWLTPVLGAKMSCRSTRRRDRLGRTAARPRYDATARAVHLQLEDADTAATTTRSSQARRRTDLLRQHRAR